jgi:hypothetical protein
VFRLGEGERQHGDPDWLSPESFVAGEWVAAEMEAEQ